MAVDKKFYKTLTFLSLPIIGQELINAFVGIVDVFMIGKLGEASIVAVGSANQIFFIYWIIIFGISSGASIFMSQYWGKKDYTGIQKILGISFLLGMIVAIVFFIASISFPRTLIGFYTKDPDVIEIGRQFLIYSSVSFLMMHLSISIMAALKCAGETRLPMVATIVALGTNVALNWVLIFGNLGFPALGVVGSGIASVIARSIQFLFLTLAMYRFRFPFAGKLREYFNFDFRYIRFFFKTAIFVILNEAIWGVGTSLYQVAYKYTDTLQQTAVQISNTLQNIFAVTAFSVGSACAIMLGNKLGANDLETAKKYSVQFLRITPALGLVMGGLAILFAPQFISIFSVSDVVAEHTKNIIIVSGLLLGVRTLNFTLIVGILRSGGDSKACFYMELLSVWIVGVPLAFLGALVFKLPIHWIVFLAGFEEIVKAFIAIYRYFKGVWIRNIVTE